MNKIIYLTLSLLIVVSCKKSSKKEETVDSFIELQKNVLSDLASNVNTSIYVSLASKSVELYNSIQVFNSTPSEQALTNARNLWKETRAIWEQSEGFLYGPVSTENIDPRIDTWPVDYNSLEAILASTNTFSETEINALDDALKGFHPIEYLLFGQNGNKVYTDFTQREKEYLIALGLNLKTLTIKLSDSWDANIADNFVNHFKNPSVNNPIYSSNNLVYIEIVNALIGICDEVANGKINEPFVAQDPLLEESPFALNSITDFKNNMISVQNVYLGKYTVDGKGLEDLVKVYNLSLDNSIKSKISIAIESLDNITTSFGDAIINSPIQVQNVIDAINDLKSELESGLLPFVQTYIK